MKNSIAYRQISLPQTPLSPSTPLRNLSYSRHLQGNRKVHTISSKFFYDANDKNDFEASEIWNKEAFIPSQAQKDDMLRVLKGKNYMLSSNKKKKLESHRHTNKKAYRNFRNQQTDKLRNKTGPFLKTNFVCYAQSPRRLTHQKSKENIIQERARAYLKKELRYEKWIKSCTLKIL